MTMRVKVIMDESDEPKPSGALAKLHYWKKRDKTSRIDEMGKE